MNILVSGSLRVKDAYPIDSERVQAIFTPDLVLGREGLGDPGETPVLLVGMPGSDGGLVEQLLRGHSQISAASGEACFASVLGRANDLGTVLELVQGMTAGQFRRLGESYRCALEESARGAARIVDCSPLNWFLVGLFHLVLPNARVVAVRRGRDEWLDHEGCYAAMIEHWTRVLPDDVMIEVDHGELLADPSTQLQRVLGHCGLAVDRAA